MITIYGGWPTRSFRVIWTAEELGLAYQLRPVDLREKRSDHDFMRLNPAGFLPVLDDDGVVMVDSIAMIEYMIAKYDGARLAPNPDHVSYAKYLQFLHLGESGLAAYLNIVVASRFFAPETERRNWGAQAAEQMFFNRLTLVTQQLKSTPMLGGEQFTAADISVIYALDMADRLGLADRFSPEVQAYRSCVSSRPGYKAANDKSPPWRPDQT